MKKTFFFVDAVFISKLIKVELSVLLTSGGYFIIHDAVYGSNNNEFEFKNALIGSLRKQCVELTGGRMCS